MKRATKRLTTRVTSETLVHLTLVRGGNGAPTAPGSTMVVDMCNTKNCPRTN